MSQSLIFQDNSYFLERYPKTSNRSLQPISNAELLVLKELEKRPEARRIHVFNDRFGVWNCALNKQNPITIWNYASQKKAVFQNLNSNGLSVDERNFKNPLEALEQVKLALIKVPKSVELFELYLQQIQKAATEDTEVICGFMTKYFNPSLLKIAAQYFEEVTQSLAWKKARLLMLKSPKTEIAPTNLIHSIPWKDSFLKQYYGVFSSGKVDIGTQFFLEDLEIYEHETEILDLASGNGVIALEIGKLQPKANLTVLDDSILAVESSKWNLSKNTRFVCDDDLQQFQTSSFDLIVSNPPFHFEYENNIEISLHLFKQGYSCLKPGGRFLLVANKHLNYTTHLSRYFSEVLQVKSNEKFEVLACLKS